MDLQVGVKVFLRNNEGKYLFLKRTKQLQDGSISWDIPGGRINPNEPILLGLQRELKEELGCDISTQDAKLLNAQDIFVQSKNFHVVRLTYSLAAPTIAIILSDEHSDFKYLSVDEAKKLVTEPELLAILEIM